jgi:biopolymer transport protein ExbD
MINRVFTRFDESLRAAEIGMTPLIDMVFLLIIFFAVTTSFTRETGITVDKAKASTAQYIAKNMLLIAIDTEGRYWYDRAQRSIDDLIGIVDEQVAQNPQMKVVLVPDKDGRVEPLVAVMDALRARNITRFSIGTAMARAGKDN